jgi:alkylhydroperoxidase family enzyme
MAPRIAPPETFDAAQLEQLAKTRPQPGGRPLNVFATLARRPELLRRVTALGGYFPRHASLRLRERELVILRVGGAVASAYVLAQHRAIAAEVLTAAETAAAADPALAHAWSDGDAALLAFAGELADTRTVGDATWAALDGVLDDDARLELVVLVGFYALFGGLTNALAVDVDAPAPSR